MQTRPKEKRRLWLLSIVVAFVGLTAIGIAWKKRQDSARPDYQQKADATEWRWSNERTTLDYCVKHNLHGYTARIAQFDDTWYDDNRQISILDGAEVVCTFHGHQNTVFVQVDDVLYVAEFHLNATHCKLVAHDLKEREELWQCWLKGNPPPGHEKYSHLINIEADGDAILVFGAEGNGRYIEYVDTKRGKTVGHKQLPRDYSLFEDWRSWMRERYPR